MRPSSVRSYLPGAVLLPMVIAQSRMALHASAHAINFNQASIRTDSK